MGNSARPQGTFWYHLSILLALVIVVPSAAADDKATDNPLIAAASKLVDIRAKGAKPFQLEIDFTAQINVQRAGHLTLKWASSDLWSEYVTLGDYKQLIVRKGETEFIARNEHFTPMRVNQLDGLLRLFSAESKEDNNYWQIKKTRAEGNSTCFEIKQRHSHADGKRSICVDTSTNELLKDETKSDVLLSEQFSDYQAIGDHRYPRDLRRYENGSLLLKASVVSLEEKSFTDADFQPAKGSMERQRCAKCSSSYPD